MYKLDPVGSTVRYEMMKLCTGSVEDILAFIYCKKWRFGQVLPMPDSLTHSAKIELLSTQLLTKYKSGALVTQLSTKVHLFKWQYSTLQKISGSLYNS